MKNFDLNDAKVYVSTYKKYNEGSLNGGWLNLSDFSDKEGFYEACKKFHMDENYPELIFQDYENIPDKLISENHISEKFFDLRNELDNLTDTEKDAFWTWINYIGYNIADNDAQDLIDEFKHSYVGEYEDEEDFAYQLVDEIYYLPEVAKTYFDYEKFAIDLFINDYYFDNGFVFQR